MKTLISFLTIIFIGTVGNAQSVDSVKTFERDTFQTSKGNLVITFIGHTSLMIETGNKVIHVDPISAEGDYSVFPKADILLITHEHIDHFDKRAQMLITKPETKKIISRSCSGLVYNALVMDNGETQTLGDFKIETVPAYNFVDARDGVSYHPKGDGNGYVINYGNKRIYIAGDTENIPEIANIKKIDIAFLPIGLPYVMTYKMANDAARTIMPTILYPYHYNGKDPRVLVDLLKDTPIEVRVRRMK